jgi:hypothetical protein
MTAICKSLSEDISSVCEFMITMTEKSDYLEGQSRQNNNNNNNGISESPRALDGVWGQSEVNNLGETEDGPQED